MTLPELGGRPELGPGQNLLDRAAGGGWAYLLPSLELGTVLVVGSPSPATLSTLLRFAREVVVVNAPKRSPPDLRDGSLAHPGLRHVAVDDDGSVPLLDGSVDVVAILGRAGAIRVSRTPQLSAELRRVIGQQGRIYVQPGVGVPGIASTTIGGDWLPRDLGRVDSLRLITQGNEVRAAAPVLNPDAIDHLERSLRARRHTPWSVRLAQRLRGRTRGRWRWEAAALAGPNSSPGPPDYIVRVAAQAGTNVEGHGWGLIDPGAYRTKKILMYLFAPGDPRPNLVVKMAREPRFNSRTENARMALALLERAGLDVGLRAPRVAFFGHHARLAILAESALVGTPMSEQSDLAISSSALTAAVEWLLQLGIRTADPAAATGPEVAASLRAMLGRFSEIYRPDPDLLAFLNAQIAVFDEHRDPVPLVLQHGDAGAWNVLVSGEGEPAFIDWEAAVTDGAPLWDILHLLRSCSLAMTRREGERNQLRAFEATFLERSALSDLLSGTIRRFCEAAGLSPELVEPLFHTCWLHRSLKEASRLTPDSLQNGRYVSVLRLCQKHRASRAGALPFAG